MPRVDPAYDGPYQTLCDVTLATGVVIEDVLPEAAREHFRDRIVKETYRWRYRGEFREIEGAWDS